MTFMMHPCEQYCIFSHTQTAGNYTIPVESMAKTLTLPDRGMLHQVTDAPFLCACYEFFTLMRLWHHQAVSKGLDSKYRVNGDILRLLAVVRSGLTAGELLGTQLTLY